MTSDLACNASGRKGLLSLCPETSNLVSKKRVSIWNGGPDNLTVGSEQEADCSYWPRGPSWVPDKPGTTLGSLEVGSLLTFDMLFCR